MLIIPVRTNTLRHIPNTYTSNVEITFSIDVGKTVFAFSDPMNTKHAPRFGQNNWLFTREEKTDWFFLLYGLTDPPSMVIGV